MEISDSVSCELFEDDSYRGCKEAEIRISEGQRNVSLRAETTHRDTANDPQMAAVLDLHRIEPTTVTRLHEKLGSWLASRVREEETWETRPLDGEYNDSSSNSDVQRLEINLSSAGMDIVGITPSGSPVENAVSIPSTEEIHDGENTGHSYLHRTHSILEIFLSGYHNESEDLIELSGHLVNPDMHLHPNLRPECRDRLSSGDHKGVVQKAGETLEETLEERVPDEIYEQTGGATDLANRAFNDSQEGFLWGYVPGEQQGIRSLYAGAFLALRNPTSHSRGNPDRNRYLDDIDKRDAIDALCFFNLLLRKLDTYGLEDLELDESEWDL